MGAKTRELTAKEKILRPVGGYDSYVTSKGKEVYLLDKESIRTNLATDDTKLTDEQLDMRKKLMPCFWIPSLTPSAGKMTVAAPSKLTVCPAGGHTLRLKQLQPVHFHLVKESERALESKKKDHMSNNAKYMCSGCRRTLTNTTIISLVAKCGHAHCARCVEQLVKKDHSCVECGAKCLKEKDLITLQHGGTSFAAAGASTASAQVAPSFQG